MNSVTFFSTLGKGMSLDLSLIKKNVFDGTEKNLRYFTTSQRKKNPMKRSGILHGKKLFMKDATNVIATDLSLSREIDELSEDGVRTVVSVPYDSCFRHNDIKPDAFMNYTHLVYGCPYLEKRWKELYQIEHLQTYDKVVFPLQKELMESQVTDDGVVVGILISGKQELREEFYEKIATIDWGDATVLVANDENMLSDLDILKNANVLISNVSEYVCAFIAKECPVFVPELSGNHFEKYMKKNFAQLYVKSKALSKLEMKWQDLHKKFYQEFVYEKTDKNYQEVLKELYLV